MDMKMADKVIFIFYIPKLEKLLKDGTMGYDNVIDAGARFSSFIYVNGCFFVLPCSNECNATE